VILTATTFEFSMNRLMLSDEHWCKLKRIMHHFRIYDKPHLRTTVEGMFYRMRTGCPWRDLPEYFGHWNSIFHQFNRWSAKNKWMDIFKSLVIDPDLEWEFVDGSIVKAHQHSAGAATIPVIPRKNNSIIGNADMDWGLYKYQHLVENIFARLKHFRSIATRYDNTNEISPPCWLWLVATYGCRCKKINFTHFFGLHMKNYYVYILAS